MRLALPARAPRRAPTAAGATAGSSPAEQRRSRGQVLIIFAAGLVAMMGVLGLATDGGFAYAERRTMQNAADAGAMAGARIVAKSSNATPLSALSDVTSLVNGNKIGSTNPTITTCKYVNDADTSVGDCSGIVPSTATGVKVIVQETHNTFFMKAIPGAPKTVTTGATAIAHVEVLKQPPTDGPFIVCGVNTTLTGSGKGTMNIVNYNSTTNSWSLNMNAANQTFVIHGPQIATCGQPTSNFKGIADQADNKNATIPGWLQYTTGTVAGPVNVSVDGIQGCQAGQPVVNCVAFLPVAVDNPVGINKFVYTVAVLPFYISSPNSNEHDATLMMDYILYGSGQQSQLGWFQGYMGGPVVIRMTT